MFLHAGAAAGSGRRKSGKDVLLGLLDQAIQVQEGVVESAVTSFRGRNPKATPADVQRYLTTTYRTSTIVAGTSVGMAAAVPGVGTAVSAAASAAEGLAFMSATSLYVLTVAHLHGVKFQDVERRRALMFAIFIGDSAPAVVEKVAGRTGRFWGRRLAEGVPLEAIKRINGILGPRFVTRYGTKQGIVVLGRVMPLGVGGLLGLLGAAVTSEGMIRAAAAAFGDIPDDWPQPDGSHVPSAA